MAIKYAHIERNPLKQDNPDQQQTYLTQKEYKNLTLWKKPEEGSNKKSLKNKSLKNSEKNISPQSSYKKQYNSNETKEYPPATVTLAQQQKSRIKQRISIKTTDNEKNDKGSILKPQL